jgi:hypothetical protein
MLPRISLAELDSAIFAIAYGSFVGSRAPVKSALFLDGQDRQPRVNARTSKKQKFLDAEIEACRNQIVLDLQILEEKFDRTIVIGLNSV